MALLALYLHSEGLETGSSAAILIPDDRKMAVRPSGYEHLYPGLVCKWHCPPLANMAFL